MTKPESRKNNQYQITKPQIFDLEERTAKFGENIIAFVQNLPKSPITLPLISQIVRSGTSVGANYLEADDAESKKDFIHKMSISRKEARETKHWLRMIALAVPGSGEEAKVLWRESQE